MLYTVERSERKGRVVVIGQECGDSDLIDPDYRRIPQEEVVEGTKYIPNPWLVGDSKMAT